MEASTSKRQKRQPVSEEDVKDTLQGIIDSEKVEYHILLSLYDGMKERYDENRKFLGDVKWEETDLLDLAKILLITYSTTTDLQKMSSMMTCLQRLKKSVEALKVVKEYVWFHDVNSLCGCVGMFFDVRTNLESTL